MSCMRVPCLENIFGLKEATPDECCSALPSTVQRNFRTPFMYIKVKDTEGMSHRVHVLYASIPCVHLVTVYHSDGMGHETLWDMSHCPIVSHGTPEQYMAIAPAARSTMDSFRQNFVLRCFTLQIAALQHTDVLQDAR